MKEKATVEKLKKRSLIGDVWRRLTRNKGAMIGLFILVVLIILALAAPYIYDYDTDVIGQNIMQRKKWPSWEHLCGTDDLGRDILARLIYGSRYSLSVGLVSVIIALFFGVTLGAIAGFYGGVAENIIMRLSDMMLAIPTFLLALVIVAALGANMGNLMLAVGITYTPKFVRVTRASVMTIRNQEFIESSRSIGMRTWKIILKHVVPNALSPIIVQTTLSVGSAIITASTLSFLGLGVPVPAPEWGSMLAGGRQYIRDYSYMTLFPGLAILFTVLSLNMLGDGLRDALDPKLKR